MANQTLLRPPFAIGKLAGCALAVAVSALTFYVWWSSLNPTQQHYFVPYRNATAWSVVSHSHRVVVDTWGTWGGPAPTIEHVLETQVYDGHSLPGMMIWPAVLSICWLLLFLILGDQVDKKRMVQFRNGRKVRGWDVITPNKYNKKTKGDGFVFLVE